MNSRPLVTTVISCKAREAARAETIPQLEAAGLTPRVFLSPCDESMPAGGRGNALVSQEALQAALEASADLLFVEDDVDLAPDFPVFLELARTANQVTYLYLHDVGHYMADRYGLSMAHAIQRGEAIDAGLYPLKRQTELSGAQCIYIPHDALVRLPVHLLGLGKIPIDRWLSLHWVDRGIRPLVALPHPVQHRQVRVARARPLAKSPDKYSKSFHLERRWPGG